MLFDLRSKSRRRTVKFVYVILALLMLSGLLLVGVGTGNNNGGILNAIGSNGSSSGQDQVIDDALNSAIKKTTKDPQSASAWYALMQARWSAANNGSNYDSTTGAYSSGGKKQLDGAVSAWQKYLTVTNDKPSFAASEQAAHVYQALTQWAPAADAWQYAIQSAPSVFINGYVCLAMNSYAAKQTSTGELAAAKAVKLTPKASKLQLQSDLSSAKSSSTTAIEYVQSSC